MLIVSIAAKAQIKPVDTVQLKINVDALQKAAMVIQARKDISIADAIPLLNGISNLIQIDSAALEQERRNKKLNPPKKSN